MYYCWAAALDCWALRIFDLFLSCRHCVINILIQMRMNYARLFNFVPVDSVFVGSQKYTVACILNGVILVLIEIVKI